jgi:hypothetical protein
MEEGERTYLDGLMVQTIYENLVRLQSADYALLSELFLLERKLLGGVGDGAC